MNGITPIDHFITEPKALYDTLLNTIPGTKA